MKGWENTEAFADEPEEVREFARRWQGIDKIMYSRTLCAASTSNTQIESEFSPAAVWEMKAAKPAELSIVGAGTPSLPRCLRLQLNLVAQRQYGRGFVYLRYRIDA